QIIDHHKPGEGLMKLMSLMAQRQNIAEQHFVALADKIQMIKEHFKLQEVMESIEVEDMMPGFKEKSIEHVKNTLVSAPEVEQDFESEKNSDCEESSVEESDESLLEPSKTFTPSYKTANGVPTVTLEVTEEQRAVFEAAMKDITSKQQKEQDKKENASVLSSLFTRRHK